ncbi:hypothetical protein IPA_02095 [Ignicoccus pacificus DSM 13166]|uniref:DUF86 domain-containing protein n=1 Tax=Ignicoccus pacificus DSM 13166 TaxID=940294 RepID=A0A977KAL6_9CREN|nr:hypothetical protein IPA_02095 [Ignicoccus pacificus DSM 13166]
MARLEKLSKIRLSEIFENDLEAILEREVEVAIQALLNLGEQVITLVRLPSPNTYAEIGKILSEAGILSKVEGKKLAAIAGLRNMLVHTYADIGYELLFDHAKDLLKDAPLIASKLLNKLEELDP